jgi:hypothetical protein
MPYALQTRDLTGQYLGFDRDIDSFRPLGGQTFLPGMCVQLCPQGTMVYPDQVTVQLPPIAAIHGLVMGIVAETWPGFSGSIAPPVFLAPTQFGLGRGTVGVDVVLRGFMPAALVDNSGTGAVTLVNELPLTNSRATLGYNQGIATTAGLSNLAISGVAMLPTTGFGSSLTAAALAQATATFTLTGTPAAGDVITVLTPVSETTLAPGVPAFTTTTLTLTTATAATVTTAAAALVLALNGNAAFFQYMTATNVAGVITMTVNGLSNPYITTLANTGGTWANSYTLSASGMVVNNAASGWTFSTSAVGGTVSTLTTNFAGGTGYKGTIPVYVPPS